MLTKVRFLLFTLFFTMAVFRSIAGDWLHVSAHNFLLDTFNLSGLRCSTWWTLAIFIAVFAALIFIGNTFSLSYAIMSSGITQMLSRNIISAIGNHPHLFIGGFFFITPGVTETITNNVAALIIFPLAIEVGRSAGYIDMTSIKVIGVIIAIAASYSFVTPIGYQTNTIIYGPGGYTFTDYVRIAIPLTVILIVVCTFFTPYFWPLKAVLY